MKRYFKICLWSPIWFPVLLWVLVYTAEIFWGITHRDAPGGLVMVGFIVMMSLVFGGIQYLTTLLLIWPRIDFDDFRSWLKWVLALPFIFAPILLLGLLLVVVWEINGLKELVEFLPLTAFGVGFGYAYVGIWLLGYGFIRMFQKFTERREIA